MAKKGKTEKAGKKGKAAKSVKAAGKPAKEPKDKAAKNWGILGLFGLTDVLTKVDDNVRSPFAPYGLGGILYTILTLRPPLPKGTLDQMLESVRTGRIEPFKPAAQMTESASAHWHIPAALSAVVRKAMALDREDRFATAGALSADVEAHLAGYATSAEEMNVAGQLWLLNAPGRDAPLESSRVHWAIRG